MGFAGFFPLHIFASIFRAAVFLSIRLRGEHCKMRSPPHNFLTMVGVFATKKKKRAQIQPILNTHDKMHVRVFAEADRMPTTGMDAFRTYETGEIEMKTATPSM